MKKKERAEFTTDGGNTDPIRWIKCDVNDPY